MAVEEIPGRVAGIDYGTVRIGVAVSDAGRRIASPWANYDRKSLAQDAQFFQRLVVSEEITLFVVGLPIHLDGRESQKSREARQFAQWLEQVTGVEVQLFDERFTTSQARAALENANFSQQRRKQRLDKIAAQILLAAYLEAGDAAGSGENTALDE